MMTEDEALLGMLKRFPGSKVAFIPHPNAAKGLQVCRVCEHSTLTEDALGPIHEACAGIA